MQRKPFLKQFRFILPIGLAVLLISSTTGAEDIYSVDLVTPSYVEAKDVLSNFYGDAACLDITLPFPFTFYKVAYTHAYVAIDGYLSFTRCTSDYRNSSLPAPSPNGAIFAFWDDIYVDKDSNVASVRTLHLGTAPNRRFVIEWRNVKFYEESSRRVDFEIVLHENGVILLQYRNIAPDPREMGNSATVGVEDETGTRAVQFSYNKPGGAIGSGEFAIRFAHLAKSVPVDIKPGGCPNPLNIGSRGVLPVAILGTSDLDVTTIDPKTVTMGGGVILSKQGDRKKVKIVASKLSSPRWSLEDVGTPYEPFAGRTDPNQCNALGPDGHLDMVFHFDTQAIAASLSDVEENEAITLQLRGQLLDGTEISGEDVVIIKGGKEKKNK